MFLNVYVNVYVLKHLPILILGWLKVCSASSVCGKSEKTFDHFFHLIN